ncbi:hypothetical protein L3X38_010745 [Prunus dulcis]|uniref:Uncharacterized protein n=1 Tax=Prunus dulcis TaxID=3755 RepID=A0AAD4WGE8_PRUDU|nr:hypothetical protein L3X38_010745 [Prunus dulcis]
MGVEASHVGDEGGELRGFFKSFGVGNGASKVLKRLDPSEFGVRLGKDNLIRDCEDDVIDVKDGAVLVLSKENVMEKEDHDIQIMRDIFSQKMATFESDHVFSFHDNSPSNISLIAGERCSGLKSNGFDLDAFKENYSAG